MKCIRHAILTSCTSCASHPPYLPTGAIWIVRALEHTGKTSIHPRRAAARRLMVAELGFALTSVPASAADGAEVLAGRAGWLPQRGLQQGAGGLSTAGDRHRARRQRSRPKSLADTWADPREPASSISFECEPFWLILHIQYQARQDEWQQGRSFAL